MARKGKGCSKSPKADWESQKENEDYFQRHQHEHKQRTMDEIRSLNSKMEGMRRPEEPVKEAPSARETFRQMRHEIVKEEDIGM